MASELWRRIRSVFASKDEASIELVMVANGVSAFMVAGVAGVSLGLTLPLAAALLPVTFVLLTACLLSRYTVWLAAVLGSTGIAVLPAMLLAGAMESLPHGRWIGGVIGTLAGFGVGFWTYYGVAIRASKGSD